MSELQKYKEQDYLEIDIQKALRLILNNEYFKEFEVIDRINQHPKGINFYEWLHNKSLISKEKLEKIQNEISLEED